MEGADEDVDASYPDDDDEGADVPYPDSAEAEGVPGVIDGVVVGL